MALSSLGSRPPVFPHPSHARLHIDLNRAPVNNPGNDSGPRPSRGDCPRADLSLPNASGGSRPVIFRNGRTMANSKLTPPPWGPQSPNPAARVCGPQGGVFLSPSKKAPCHVPSPFERVRRGFVEFVEHTLMVSFERDIIRTTAFSFLSNLQKRTRNNGRRGKGSGWA